MNKTICFILCFLCVNAYSMQVIHGRLQVEYGAALEIASGTDVRVVGIVENYGTITAEESSTTSSVTFESEGKIRNFATLDPTVAFSPSDFPPFRMPFFHKNILVTEGDLPRITLENGIPLGSYASYFSECELWIYANAVNDNRLDDKNSILRVAVVDAEGTVSVPANLSCKLEDGVQGIPIKLSISRGTIVLKGDNSQYIDGKVSVSADATAVIASSTALPQSDIKVDGKLEFTAPTVATSYTTAPGKTVDISDGGIDIDANSTVIVSMGGTMIF